MIRIKGGSGMSDDLYDGPCEAGCISFHGGERKHHKDCGHYPHSLTKVNADRIAELEAKLAKLARAAKPFAAIKIKDGRSQPGEIGRTDVTNLRAALAELKGEDRG